MSDIPADWRDLPWPALRSIASKLSSEPVRNRADAVKAIELASRAPAGDAPVKFTEAPADQWSAWPPVVDIPEDWHETMTVPEIIALAARISPDGGNPVEIIKAEVARRSAAAT